MSSQRAQLDIVLRAQDAASAQLKQVSGEIKRLENATKDAARAQGEAGKATKSFSGEIDGLRSKIGPFDKVRELVNAVRENFVFLAPAVGLAVTAITELVDILSGSHDPELAKLITQYYDAEQGAYDMRDSVFRLGKQAESTAGKLQGLRIATATTAATLARAAGDESAAKAFEAAARAIGLEGQLQEQIALAERANREIGTAQQTLTDLEERRSKLTGEIEDARKRAVLDEVDANGQIVQRIDTAAEALADVLDQKSSVALALIDGQIAIANKALEENAKAAFQAEALAENLRGILGLEESGVDTSALSRPRQGKQRTPSTGGRRSASKAPKALDTTRGGGTYAAAEAGKPGQPTEADLDYLIGQEIKARKEADRLAEAIYGVSEALTGGLGDVLPSIATAIDGVANSWARYGDANFSVADAVSSSVVAVGSAIAANIEDEKTRAGVLAAIQFGLGLGKAFVPGKQLEAAGHFASAAALGLVAGGVIGTGSGSSAATSATGTLTDLQSSSASNDNGQPSTVVYNISGGIMDGQSTYRAVQRSQRSVRGTGWERRAGW